MDEWRYVLCDPQTSGGLLVAVEEESVEFVEQLLMDVGIETESIGVLQECSDNAVRIIVG